MDKDEMIKALKEIKKECCKHKRCSDCDFYDTEKFGCLVTYIGFSCNPCEWNIEEIENETT